MVGAQFSRLKSAPTIRKLQHQKLKKTGGNYAGFLVNN
jgi:hypothetical protein